MNKSLHKKIFFITTIYFVIVSIFMFAHRSFFSPDQFFAAAMVITFAIGRFKQFVQDWSVPTTVFLSYEYFRGLVPKLSIGAHIHPMINFDKAVFGFIPTIKLQTLLFSDGKISWYDYLAVIIYMSHFIVPLMVMFILWLKNKEYFKEYSFALLILSYLAFITYLSFPAMPPWMAGQLGFIPDVYKVMDRVFSTFPQPIDLPTVYRFVGTNSVAAVPSLHAAYPWLLFLFTIKRFKFSGLAMLPYVLSVWFAIVYLGEHYVFDIVLGVLYSTVVFMVVVNRQMILQKIKLSNFIFERR